MGASCVRDCERTVFEMKAAEDEPPGQVPGQVSSIPAASSNAKIGSSCQSTVAAVTDVSRERRVPVMPQWFKVTRVSLRFILDPGNAKDESKSPETPRSSSSGSAEAKSPRPEEIKDGTDNEVSYEGTLLGSAKHGIGRLRMDGSVYEGDFRNDLKHGVGVLTWDDGRQYHGQFQFGKFHGNAIMTWPDGRRYCGQYAEDRKHGEGTFSWQDGRRYQGQWVTGKRHGIGIYTNAKGLTRTGLWQMDRPLSWETASPTLNKGFQAELDSDHTDSGDAEAQTVVEL